MADNLSPTERSEIMSRVVSKGTRPEIVIRKLVWNLGYRYRLNVKNIPGKPDIAFIGKKKAIFVNGCFWHRHGSCPLTRTPKSNIDFWTKKFDATIKTDKKNLSKLEELGWKHLIIWECEITSRNIPAIREKIINFMEDKEN